MKLKFLPVCATLILLATATPALADTSSDCALLSRNLKLGMTGSDVKALQRLLNAQVATRVSDSGPGSPGNEGVYFGTKTKLAVVRFQELYKGEVLTPAGLTKGNGFVGSLSRAKLKLLCGSSVATGSTTPTPSPIPTPTSPPALPTPPPAPRPSAVNVPAWMNEKPNTKPYIGIQPAYAVHQGDTFVVNGGGYSSVSNTVNIGSLSFTGLVPTKRGSLEVKIPANATKGKFDLTFTNSKGTSNKTFVIITDPAAIAPKVTAFTPKTGLEGAQITVTGTNFSSEWNELIVGSELVKAGPSKDGKTLTFTATLPVPGLNPGQDVGTTKLEIPLWFYVINPNGVSNSSVFTLNI